MKSVAEQFMKNAATSWAGNVLGIGIAFFFTPYLISELGKDRYGVWTLALSLLAYIKLADVGMGQAIVRYISRSLASRDWGQLNAVVSSAARLYFVVAGVTLVAALAISLGALHLLKIPSDIFRTAQTVVIILGIRQAIFFLSLPFVSLGAFHRFDIVNYFGICGQVVQTALMVVLLELGFGMEAMALLILVLDVASVCWRHRIRRRLFPEVRFSWAATSPRKTKELMGYGLYTFLIMLAWTVIQQTDNIVIAGFLSTEAVALYSVPSMIVFQLINAGKTISVPLIPAVSHYEALSDYDRIIDVFLRGTKYLYYLSAWFCISVFFFGGPFVLLWVGQDFEATIPVMQILTLSVMFTLPQLVSYAILLGTSRHRLAFVLAAAEACSKILLSLLLVGPLGMIGMALSTAIPQLVIYSVVYPAAVNRTLGSKPVDFYRRAGGSVLAAGLLLTPIAWAFKRLIPPDDWLALIVDCTVVGLVMLAGLFGLILLPEDRTRAFTRVRDILHLGRKVADDKDRRGGKDEA